jgi:hypothetical protein
MIKIFFVYNNNTTEIEIKSNKTIQQLKQVIEERIKIPKEFVIIKNEFGDFIFEKTLIENNITNEQLLYINVEEDDFKKEKELYCGKIF